MSITIPNTTTDTDDAAALTGRAVYLLVESMKADRAGSRTAPVVMKAHDAVQAVHEAGIPTKPVHREADTRFAIYLLNCQLPGYEPRIDEDGDGHGITAREAAEEYWALHVGAA